MTGGNNQLESDGIYNYEYDSEGNLIRQTEIATGAVREFEWDYRNRLVALVDSDALAEVTQSVSYTYDALNRRISKTVDGSVTYFVHDSYNSLSNVALEFGDEDGVAGSVEPVLTQRYLHGSRVDKVLAQEDGDGNLLWHLGDHLGTIRDLVDNSGELMNHYIYDSFGNVIAQTDNTVENRRLFTGREFDVETGLYYYRARYYYSPTGRFLGLDPIGFEAGDSNLYRYVGNSPVDLIDPSGLQVIPIVPIGPILSPTIISPPVNLSCLRGCLTANLGLNTALGVIAVILGQPLIPYPRSGLQGSTGFTSPASSFLARIFPQRFPGVRFPAPTLANPGATTPVLGRALGRWVPILGWVLTTPELIIVASCFDDCEEPINCND